MNYRGSRRSGNCLARGLSGTTARLFFCPTRLVLLLQAPGCRSPEMLRWSTRRLMEAATVSSFTGASSPLVSDWPTGSTNNPLCGRVMASSTSPMTLRSMTRHGRRRSMRPLLRGWHHSMAAPRLGVSSPFPSGILNPVGRSAGYQNTL